MSDGACDSPANAKRCVEPEPLNGVRLLTLMPTDTTPGSAATCRMTSLTYALRWTGVAYGFFDGSFGSGIQICVKPTRAGLRPGFTCSMLQKLRTSSPAPTSS